MKKIIFSLILLFLAVEYLYAFQVQEEKPDYTTLLFVRHAERAEDGTRNPPISEEGQKRAVNLFHEIDDNFDVVAIYSTAYKRTQMTATPTADSLGLEITEYGFDDLENFLSGLILEYSGKAVLIVGHSNTTPRLINMVLGREEFEQLQEHDYGDLFIVRSLEYGMGSVEVGKF